MWFSHCSVKVTSWNTLSARPDFIMQRGISSRWSVRASCYSLSEWGNSDRQSEPTTKGKWKNNWKWIPTNTNSLLLNCFGLAWSIAKKRVWSGMAWKRNEGRRGAPPQQSWIMGSLFDMGTCDFFFFFVMEMVPRYFITQYVGYSFRYRLLLHPPWLIMNNDDDDNDYCDSLCISLKQRQ